MRINKAALLPNNHGLLRNKRWLLEMEHLVFFEFLMLHKKIASC